MNLSVVGPLDKLSGRGVAGVMLTLEGVWVWVVTVTPVLPITLPLVACTVAVPKATAVSKPPLAMVATLVGVVLQVTEDVTSAVELLP